MRTRIAAAVLLVSLVSAFALPAHATGDVVVAGPEAALVGYATPAAVVVKGTTDLTFVDADPVDWHNLVSVEVGPDTNPWCSSEGYPTGGCPLFWSVALHSAGETSTIQGLDALASGQAYTFVCEHHPGTMIGALVAV